MEDRKANRKKLSEDLEHERKYSHLSHKTIREMHRGLKDKMKEEEKRKEQQISSKDKNKGKGKGKDDKGAYGQGDQTKTDNKRDQNLATQYTPPEKKDVTA